MKQCYYKNEEDAEDFMRQRRSHRGISDSDTVEEREPNMNKSLDISPVEFEEEEC